MKKQLRGFHSILCGVPDTSLDGIEARPCLEYFGDIGTYPNTLHKIK